MSSPPLPPDTGRIKSWEILLPDLVKMRELALNTRLHILDMMLICPLDVAMFFLGGKHVWFVESQAFNGLRSCCLHQAVVPGTRPPGRLHPSGGSDRKSRKVGSLAKEQSFSQADLKSCHRCHRLSPHCDKFNLRTTFVRQGQALPTPSFNRMKQTKRRSEQSVC